MEVCGPGRNNYGQLGDGTKIDRYTPIKIVTGGVVSISAGGYETFYIDNNGSLWGTGRNDYGQLEMELH